MEFDDQEEPEEEIGLPPGSGSRKVTTPGSVPAGGGRYSQCLKNHAVTIGGHAVDGCGEFMPAGEDGTLDALRCAACSCHRNFHRKELGISSAQAGGGLAPGAAEGGSYHHHHQFSPYYRSTSAGYLHHHHRQQQHVMAAAARATAPLALPSTSWGGGGGGGGGAHSEGDEDDLSDPMGEAGMGASGSGKKRHRTKFTQEQKEKMLSFAERVGWRIQKQDEAAVQQFCNETAVKRHVLKVWMHNNKHTLVCGNEGLDSEIRASAPFCRLTFFFILNRDSRLEAPRSDVPSPKMSSSSSNLSISSRRRGSFKCQVLKFFHRTTENETVVVPECYCGIRASFKISWTERNPGRRFFNCGHAGMARCEFFSWYDPSPGKWFNNTLVNLLSIENLEGLMEQYEMDGGRPQEVRRWDGRVVCSVTLLCICVIFLIFIWMYC